MEIFFVTVKLRNRMSQLGHATFILKDTNMELKRLTRAVPFVSIYAF